MTTTPKTKFAIDDQVWVPTAKLPGTHAFALAQRRVLGQKESGRSVIIDDGDGGTVTVSSRLVHASPLGVLLLRMGDLETEATLLDPLAKSVLQYLRLLLPDDAITAMHVRTAGELEVFMRVGGPAISHVVLVGHGKSDAVKLPDDQWLPVDDFVSALALGGNVRSLISLACSTGKQTFGAAVTVDTGIRDFAAPTTEVHGATASLFAQHLLAEHILEGREFATAARHANEAIKGTDFVHWRNGVQDGVKKPGRRRKR